MVADDGVTELAVLSEGNFFGEISILNIKGKTKHIWASKTQNSKYAFGMFFFKGTFHVNSIQVCPIQALCLLELLLFELNQKTRCH